ncbi:probable serine/threonine-protein kinase tsuA [Gordionus sp. m RMFG-2023]|uniref:probable serine/threonine-protein kinase tsuA n=1 Tax=Gordionus sp. m RMFG-2023 TaxID=3053472 RepID=UPI0031FDCB74
MLRATDIMIIITAISLDNHETRPYYDNIRLNNQNNYHFPRRNYDRFCHQNRWETSYIPFNNHDTGDNNNNRFNINNKAHDNNYKPFNDFKNYNRFDNTRQPFHNFRDYNRSNVHQQFYDRDNKNYMNHNPKHQVPYSNKINTVDIEEIEDDKIISIDKKDYDLLNIDINNVENEVINVKDDAYMVNIKINNILTSLQVDTGTKFTILLKYMIEKVGIKNIKKSNIQLSGYDGKTIQVIGSTRNVEYEGSSQILDALIINSNKMPLLGRSWLKHFKNILERFISLIDTDHKNDLAELISNCKSKLNNKPVIKTQVRLRLKLNAKPKIIPPRRVPYSRAGKQNHRAGKSRWASPLTPVFKNNGSLRLCTDFKGTVNPALEDFKYPIPRINDLIAKLAGGKKFSDNDEIHLENIKKVFEKIIKYGLTPNFDKNKHGIHPHDDKIKAIIDTGTKKFRRIIYLLRHGELLPQPPTLNFFNPDLLIGIAADASNRGLGYFT